jgi:putative flavoprotein involved in K+ transport
MPERQRERIETVVIGAGQAGLSVGHHLARRGLPFVILEANDRVGDTWRRRWDSLRLFTPARYDALDGLPFPAPAGVFPTKDAMGDYLESYAAHFDLPVRTGVRVERVSREDGRYLVEAGDRAYEADHVVVAMASFQRPRAPELSEPLDDAIVRMHSLDYRGLRQLAPGGVLVVGAGNSGAEIALEAARGGHQVWLAGRHPGHVPFRIETALARHVLVGLIFRVVFHRLLTIDTPMGRRARTKTAGHGTPLVRVKPADLSAAGVERVARVVGVRDGRPLLEDGRVLDAANVIWCTGFAPGFSWIDVPVFEPTGEPRHARGVVEESPGLYFVGLHFLYAMSSAMIHGVGRDAEHIARTIDGVRRAGL